MAPKKGPTESFTGWCQPLLTPFNLGTSNEKELNDTGETALGDVSICILKCIFQFSDKKYASPHSKHAQASILYVIPYDGLLYEKKSSEYL